MDYEAYRKAYFTDPTPEILYGFGKFFGFALFFEKYEEAAAFYSSVLGPPAYVEGEFTRGWQLGTVWLTILKSSSGRPKNTEIQLVMTSDEDAEKLRQAFLEAGGSAEEPEKVLMYEPLKVYSMSDPFGTAYLLVTRSEG